MSYYCWWCYWGWPLAIIEIYERARDDIDALLPIPSAENDWTEWQGAPLTGEQALRWGPAHCVWEDENFDGDFSFEFRKCDEIEKRANWHPGAMDIVRRSLRELQALAEGIRNPAPTYGLKDDDEPSDFPPPAPLLMSKDRCP